MIRDLTLEAVERLISAALPQDAARVHYLGTEKRKHDMEFDYAEIIADPYVVEVSDNDGIPSMATCIVLANYIADNNEEAERFLSVVLGFAYALTPKVAEELAKLLPEPLNLLRVVKVEPRCNGAEARDDDTVVAQIQFTITLRPLIIEQ